MNKNQIAEASIRRESRTIRHNHSQEDMNLLREEFTNSEISRSSIEEELKEIKKEFKFRIDAMKKKSRETMKEIRNRYVDREHDVHLVPNHAEGIIEFYDVNTGELLDSRKMRPDEKQLRISPLEKTA